MTQQLSGKSRNVASGYTDGVSVSQLDMMKTIRFGYPDIESAIMAEITRIIRIMYTDTDSEIVYDKTRIIWIGCTDIESLAVSDKLRIRQNKRSGYRTLLGTVSTCHQSPIYISGRNVHL